MKFTAKRDSSYIGIYVITIALMVGANTALFMKPEAPIIGKVIFTIMFFTIALFITIHWINTYYILKEEMLVVVYGFKKYKIKYDEIINIGKGSTLLAGPSYSSNKITIVYNKGKGYIFVSPKNEEKFIELLIQKCKNATFTFK